MFQAQRNPTAWAVLMLTLTHASKWAYGNDVAVSHHNKSSISPQDAGNILSQATTVLRSNSCNVPMTLSPTNLPSFIVPISGTIDGPDDFAEVCQQPGYVHVVSQIHYCQGAQGDILGCSPVPGKCSVVVRDAADIEGALWAHEYGHTKGLHHRSDSKALMNPYVTPQSKELLKKECDAFKSAGSIQLAQRHPRYRTVAFQQSASEREAHVDVIEFVHRRYFEGVPYDIASSYSHDDAVKLVPLIENPEKEKPYLPAIVTTLGMIGDPIGVEPLVRFIEKGTGTLDSPMFRAKTSALIALGYIVNRSKDTRALDYLIKGLNPATWLDRKIEWRAPDQEKQEERTLVLVKSSILGLALAGTPDAEKALSSAEEQVKFAGEPQMTQETQRAVARALQLNRRVQQQGLKQYYLQNQMR